MRLLWMSNAPWAPTAYGQQTKLHVPRLAAMGHDMAIFAFWGLQGAPLSWQGIKVYPCGLDAWGSDIVQAHADHHQADVIICNYDSWKITPDAFDTPYVARFPVDMQPLSQPIHGSIAPALVRIVESRFGQQMVKNAGLDCVYVPAAIETKVYYPADQAQARRDLGWPAGKFIVGMVAANRGQEPSRKGFEAAFRAFKTFSDNHPEAILYLHTTNGEMDSHSRSIDLLALAHMEEIADRVVFGDQYAITAGLIPDTTMANIYRAMDVLLCTSMGEGVCVPLIEAQACGTPVIAPGWTATNELVFGGWKLTENEPYPFTRFQAYQFSPRSAEIAQKLETAYTAMHTELSAYAYRLHAVNGAQRFDIEYVAAHDWPIALAQIAERLQQRRHPLLTTLEQCEQCAGTNPWAKIGWMPGNGTIETPCSRSDCANGVRTNTATNQHTFMPGLFPMAVGDMALDIQDTPPGSVAKVVAREAIASYHLDDLTFLPGDVILDIGAHVGVMSIYLSKMWPETRIIAVEPHPANYANLQRNIEANDCRNVTTFHGALAAEHGTLTLHGDHAQNTGGMGVCNIGGEAITVNSTTLADLVASFDIDRIALLKLDCEGAEYQVIESSSALLGTVDRLIGEFHQGQSTPDAQVLLEYVRTRIPYVNVSICKV